MLTAAALISVGIFVYCVLILLLEGDGTSDAFRIRMEEIRVMGRELTPEEKLMSRSFSSRILTPIFANIVSKLGKFMPVREKDKDRISLMMLQAGLRLTPEEYVAVQILFMAGGTLLGVYLSFTVKFNIILCVLFGIYAGVAVYRFSLSAKISRRKEKLAEQMPEVLDLLSVSVEAGLGLNQAMQYVTEQCRGVLIDEFAAAQKEMSLGRSRRVALTSMAKRCGIEEVQAFTGAVIQADEMGISLRNILSSQADEIRILRKMKIEEKAQKIPIKILLPMVLFIFPVIFIILMGPIIPSVMDAMGGI